ncbi:MAG: phosphotransferase, partial [Actinomycetota bacterium]|nr:phosphotransferase [Actinomycetota bacterium]
MDDAPPDGRSIAGAFRLGGLVGELKPVPGAWSNRVYRLVVGSDTYAVKEMRNPWGTAHWRDWLDEAWEFEQRAIAAGVAAPASVPAPDGGCLAEVARVGGGSCSVRLHQWVNGTPAALGPATRGLARWAGETLATMHALRIAPANRAVFPMMNTENAERWPDLVREAWAAGVGWAGDAEAAMSAIARVA